MYFSCDSMILERGKHSLNSTFIGIEARRRVKADVGKRIRMIFN